MFLANYISYDRPPRCFFKDPIMVSPYSLTPSIESSLSYDPSIPPSPRCGNSPHRTPSYLAALMESAGLPFATRVPSSFSIPMPAFYEPRPHYSPSPAPLPVPSSTVPPSITISPPTKEEPQIPEPEPSPTEKPKSKRGRKKKKVTPEIIEADTKRRMERNRVFARENRRKKKQYIYTMEGEVIF